MSGGVTGENYIQIVYFALLLFYVIYEWQKVRMETERNKSEIAMTKMYYDTYEELIEAIRDRQHDMKNHITAILGMSYACDNYEELVNKQREYCDYVLESTKDTKLVLSSENHLISGFLYSKIKVAEKLGIIVEYKLIIDKRELPIPEYEVVEMAGILFDNAMEAMHNSTEEIKKIKVVIKHLDTLEISVANISNVYGEQKMLRFFERNYSSKGLGRGIGLNKLKRMVKVKNGKIIVANEIMEENNYLKFTIII